MLETINEFVMVIIISIATFMVERYVLLEPPMESKKQRLFYIVAFSSIAVGFLFIQDAAQFIALFFGGLNIFFGRKKHRILGVFMMIPLIGIINGAVAPVFIVQAAFGMDESDMGYQIGVFVVYLIILLLLFAFYFKGKEWRRWFGENMKNRKPLVSEYVLCFVAGIIISFCSVYLDQITLEAMEYSTRMSFLMMSSNIIYQFTAFTLTTTIVILIMQGNRRKYYHDKVAAMQFNIIATMADIVENRDENTGGHIKRTARYVEIIGKKLQADGAFAGILTDRYLSDMVVAAPLHDIGKIHIPDSILNKPGRLTDEEYAVMKTHTTAGRDVLLKATSQLGEFEYLNTAVEMAEYHHEWWNGKGYPNAVKGEEIPLCARIMAVADVFDALTAKRCYKEAMPVEKAYSIIEEETGTHFDPTVAEAFLSCKKEVEEAIRILPEDE